MEHARHFEISPLENQRECPRCRVLWELCTAKSRFSLESARNIRDFPLENIEKLKSFTPPPMPISRLPKAETQKRKTKKRSVVNVPHKTHPCEIYHMILRSTFHMIVAFHSRAHIVSRHPKRKNAKRIKTRKKQNGRFKAEQSEVTFENKTDEVRRSNKQKKRKNTDRKDGLRPEGDYTRTPVRARKGSGGDGTARHGRGAPGRGGEGRVQ